MKGKLVKKEDTWYVTRLEENEWETYYPLHEDSVNEIKAWEQVFDNVDARIASNQEVDFHFHELWEEVDGETKVTKFAKLGPVPTDENNYPLIQGTMDICNEMIYNRDISDEEIEKAAKDYHWKNGVYYAQEKTFIDAIKWYREQLKKKK